jgi:enoyl-CoA hydratase
VAGGTEILQATEIRVAAESAQLGIAEVRRGLFPLGGSTVRLQRQIGFTMAADLLLTGRLISRRPRRSVSSATWCPMAGPCQGP